jgi:hypothetical protein
MLSPHNELTPAAKFLYESAQGGFGAGLTGQEHNLVKTLHQIKDTLEQD